MFSFSSYYLCAILMNVNIERIVEVIFLRIGILQTPTRSLDTSYNINWTKEHLHQIIADKPDLILLPEYWTTGFCPNAMSGIRQVDHNPVRAFFSDFARQYGVTLVSGSMPIQEGEVFYNRAYVYNEQGNEAGFYDKVHLYPVSGEDVFFKAGDHICTFDCQGIKVGIATCYDIDFPEWIRLIALQGIQLLVMPAAWPNGHVDKMHLVAKARAVENQIFIAIANSSETYQETRMTGGYSAVYGPSGRELLALGLEGEAGIVDIDMTSIDKLHDTFNLFQDRKPKVYQRYQKTLFS